MRGLKPVRRVVTGVDADGRSTVASDEICPFTFAFPGVPDYGATDIWRTGVPADNADPAEPCYTPFEVEPPKGGAVFRLSQFPPDSLFIDDFDRDAAFGSMPGTAHVTEGASIGNGTFHRTTSVDFAVVVSGEIYALLETGEVKLTAGDTLVQRGTVHGWSNRGSEDCLIAFVLVDELRPPTEGKK
ncbi:cupin domain-containing protein [Amycolatopsis pithecellobii]|uniref:Cupin domain-containing protein n=1 Tax=Amycolatopsis pithecellobii TaxID=664692 RepID=A0A6N7YNX3_9PSEU|nr:cupin domain-containing protein [Amycolatopsis pithecellobii]MTD54695.1 cupin domain-containing protein [Amycolatopsis pithecellobii]